MARENAKDWVGTTTVLWGITAAVYMSLLGPQGMKELGRDYPREEPLHGDILRRVRWG